MKKPQETTAATRLMDTIIKENQLKNDSGLCRFLDIAPPTVSKLRYNKINVSADLVIRIHEKTGKSIADIKAALAS